MIVRQRTQYFPDGGGAIGPVGGSEIPSAVAYVAGAAAAGRAAGGGGAAGTEGPGAPPTGSGGGGGTADVVSTCGSVYPHLAQNSAPSRAISPQ